MLIVLKKKHHAQPITKNNKNGLHTQIDSIVSFFQFSMSEFSRRENVTNVLVMSFMVESF